ncbi:iron-enterobactin transporter permease [Sphaerisporangium siamense]|uniref:Iron complex transport system permease protein n=1 Tax=Sphaerisporangium siamense TaxID=795645 RepID=A0A7W7D7F5_9ACTN|nr:iron chelate uptake ABC transporter family permease subunit [Sphaerisporangium siamense]MBB4700745.1 iron complex transport system permease protein [Sphaerisporangium siamense]GII88796.1 iron-enterobactin transporter permease [Sphaerisporangium siamense]
MSDLVLRAGRFSARIERRTAVVSLVLVAVALLLALLGLCYGASWTTPSDALSALAGHGDSAFVVREWRAPRVAAALVFGASLGLAGAIFQNITRNPLGSPDVIGLDAGAYTGALISITVLGGTAVQLAVGSILGGLLAAAAVYFLSLGSGLSGLRLIVIGIAMNAILTAVNSWIVLRAELEIAMAATGWSSGSLNGVEWAGVRLPFLVIGVLTLLLVTLSYAMHQSALGDELAVTSGVALNRLRLLLVLAGVGCTATVTAVAGPIVFIALAAPQIGRRLAGAGGVPLVAAALTGAVLLLAADLIAQLLLAPVALPVGVVTTAIGGCYLIWLLVKEVRRP